MTNLQVVQALRSRGHLISYVTRSDGSIRITSIDGNRFSARESNGNNLARSMLGEQLSEKTVLQRERASIYAGKGKVKAGREITLKSMSNAFQKAYRKYQKELREYRKTLPAGKDNPFAYLRADKLLRAVRYEGEAGVLARIKEMVEATKGKAQSGHIALLAKRLKNYSWGLPIIEEFHLEDADTVLPAGGVDLAIRFMYDVGAGSKTNEEIADQIRKVLSMSIDSAPKTNDEKSAYKRREDRITRGVSRAYVMKPRRKK